MPLEPATVWMVHARTGPAGHRGQISLTDEGVRFTPRSGSAAETVIPFADIKRVRRVWASPVLELALRTPNGVALAILGFYFVKPPNLEPPEDLRILRRRRTKTRAANELRRGNLMQKETVAAWAEEVKRAKAAADARRRGS
jgi:hypothetical protein